MSSDVETLGVQPPVTDSPALTPGDVRRIAAIADPVIRNLQITQAYHELSLALARLTGPGANWCTIATWASKQAGQSIRQEDLAAAFERLLRGEPAAQASGRALLAERASVTGQQASALGVGEALAALWDAINPAAAFQRTSVAVARGNVKVFAEIGEKFAWFLEVCTSGAPDQSRLAGFYEDLRDGDPPEGQGYLRRSFTHYAAAMHAADERAKAQLLLLANLEIGFHEQMRLQEDILEAMNAPLVDPRALRQRLVAELFPDAKSRVRFWLARLAGRLHPLIEARDLLADEAQRAARRAVSAALMTLALPGGRVLQLGQDLPAAFPPLLARIDLPELLSLLARVDPTPDSPAGTGAKDWSRLTDRMHFIADLFRSYHSEPSLFEPPFIAEQVRSIKGGQRPAGPL